MSRANSQSINQIHAALNMSFARSKIHQVKSIACSLLQVEPCHTMFYELFAIARIQDPIHVNKEAVKIASTVGKLILNNRGVIRQITSLGPKPLPKIISKDQERHFQGYHFIMAFDSSSAVQQELLRTLRRDPRILRSNIVKNDMTRRLDVGTTFERVFSSVSD